MKQHKHFERKALRKGSVMELAILVILITMILSTLIVTFATVGTMRTANRLSALALQAELNDAATAFLSDGTKLSGYAFDTTDWDTDDGTFTVTKDGKTLTVTVNGSHKITTWKLE